MYKWFKWCISDLCSVSDWLKARGYPCAKGYNSSASQWLSGEQVRLCSGHPKVHFGTIVEGSWRVGRGCTAGPTGSLTIGLDATDSSVRELAVLERKNQNYNTPRNNTYYRRNVLVRLSKLDTDSNWQINLPISWLFVLAYFFFALKICVFTFSLKCALWSDKNLVDNVCMQ